MQVETRRPWYKPEAKDLLWSAGLLLIGFGGNWLLASGALRFSAPSLKPAEPVILFVLVLSLYLAIGAGFGAPFQRKALGALIVLLSVGSIMAAVYLQ